MTSSPDSYLSVDQACKAFGFSRTTFYRMLADPELGLAKVVVRVPPGWRIKVPARRFEEWLRRVGRV